MNKKLVILIIFILLLIAGGVFWWWQSGKESRVKLRELNKNLPEGIKVIEEEGRQVIVNEKDGYEIKVPEEWGGLKEIDTLGAQLSMKAKNTEDWVAVEVYKLNKIDDLEYFLKNEFKSRTMWVAPVITGKERIGDYEVIKMKDETMVGDYFIYYFQKDSKLYEIYTDHLEENIREVILNGSF